MRYNFLTLAFNGKWKYLETQFLEFHFKESLTRIRIAILIAAFFYSIFGILDAVIAPDQKVLFWIIRYAIVSPFALWIFWFSFQPVFRKYAQISLFTMCLIGGLGIEAMVILADPPATYSYYAGIILIFITIFTFVRMQFLWSVACSWLIVLFYEIGAIFIADTPRIMLINNNFFFVSANIFCMLAGYYIELNVRKRFFYNVCLEKEKEKVMQANLELDQRVRERTHELSAANEQLSMEIKERVAAEKSRLQMEKELNKKKNLELIGALTGGIAHDFNNILSGVIGYSELTLETLDKTSSEYAHVEQILQAGIRASELTRQILTFSRKVERAAEPVQLGEITKEALKLIRVSIPSSIKIVQKINTTSFIMGDESQLHRVIMNLCINGFHAMGKKKGTLEVRVEDSMTEQYCSQESDPINIGHYVKLTVTDTGSGMRPDVIEKIFDPFFTTKTSSDGTGMGLSVVQSIVKQYKGIIRVNSKPGQGTTFVLLFPILDKEDRIESIVSESIKISDAVAV